MYKVFGQIGHIGSFETMDKAVDHARGTSVYEDIVTVENSEGTTICYVSGTVASWTTKEFLEEYKKLKEVE